MPYWDRFDICEAYLAIEMDWNVGGFVKGKNISYQLFKMRFKASPLFRGYKSLSENGKEIYINKVNSLGFITNDEANEMLKDGELEYAGDRT